MRMFNKHINRFKVGILTAYDLYSIVNSFVLTTGQYNTKSSRILVDAIN